MTAVHALNSIHALSILGGSGTASQVAELHGIMPQEAGEKLAMWCKAGQVRRSGTKWCLVSIHGDEKRLERRRERAERHDASRKPLLVTIGEIIRSRTEEAG